MASNKHGTWTMIAYTEEKWNHRYRKRPVPGGWGYSGGNGGAGGFGGRPGAIAIHSLGNVSAIATEATAGGDGEPGSGGYGGPGGITLEYHIDCQWIRRWAGYIPVKTDTHFVRSTIDGRIRQPSGSNGSPGAYLGGRRSPSAALPQQPLHIPLNYYKKYLWENVNDSYKKLNLKHFIDLIDTNADIQQGYDTLGLVNELQALQEQSHTIDKEDLVHFYQSLLNRIKLRSKNPKNVANSDDKKVLQYLYTAILTVIYNLKYNSEPLLVIDINGYLDLVIQSINMLKAANKEHNEKTVINQHKTHYKENIDKKIQEAKEFVETHITPEMNAINAQIDKKIDFLINETLSLQEDAKREKEELMRRKEELERTLALRGFFSAFKVIGEVVSFCGPIGAAVGSVIGAGTSLTESLALDEQTAQHNPLQLPPSVGADMRFLEDEIKSLGAQNTANFNNFLNDVQQEADNYPESLSDISAKVAHIQYNLKETDAEQSFEAIQDLEEELKQEMQKKEGELSEKTDADERTARALVIVGKFNRVMKLGHVGLDIYNKHKNDQARLEAVRSALSDDKIKKLEDYEKKIYTVITPMLRNMGNHLNTVANKLEEKSQVALDVSKWQVQSALRDLKLLLQHLTRGFNMEDHLARCVEKLEEAMTTLIKIYDRIQEYQQQQELADYIADINSPASSNIQIKDPNLSGAVSYLEVLIRSNIVLQQSNTAIGAFKQWVFPLVHRYIESPKMGRDTEITLSTAVTYIESLKSKVQEYKTSIKREDEFTLCGWFNSEFVSSEPFFVWKYATHRNMITNLLSGKKVAAKADVVNSPTDKDAIKFNLIEIHFKSANETVQSAIDDKLRGFKASVIHLGNSYYRDSGNVYVIMGERQEIQYTFEKNDKGEPVHENIVYRKMKAGDLMLSPYTTWEIQLINLTDRVLFHELQAFEDGIDLELVGRGSYISRGNNIPDLLVEDYYSGDAMSAEEEMLLDEDATLRDGYSTRRHPRGDKDDLRRRRHAAHAQKEHSDDRLAAASSAGSSLAPPGGRIVNWLKRKVWQLAHLNPMAQVRKLLGSDVNSSGNDAFEIAEATWGSAVPRMDERFALERGFVSDYSSESWCLKLLSGEPDTSSAAVSDGIHVNGMLTLADFVARLMTGVQYENPQTAERINMQECLHREYAQRLMFRSYLPRDDINPATI